MSKAYKWFKFLKILTLGFQLLLIVESVASLMLTSAYGLNTGNGEQLFLLIMATLSLIFFLAVYFSKTSCTLQSANSEQSFYSLLPIQRLPKKGNQGVSF